MKIKNLYYGIIGLIAYYKQTKANKVNLKATKANKVDVVTVDDRELSIHYIPDMNKRGVAYGAIFVFPHLDKKTFIGVDDKFYALPQELQQAVIYHEVGHYAHGHFSNKGFRYIWQQCVQLGKIAVASEDQKANLLYEFTMMTRNDNEEYEADAYAVNKVGAHAVAALLLTFYSLYPSEELAIRYQKVTGEAIETSSAFLELKKQMAQQFTSIFKDAEVVSIETL